MWVREGGISTIYRLLLDIADKLPYMQQWDLDLVSEKDLHHWHTCFHFAYKGILNISLVEASIKFMTRWYMVPFRL